MKASEFDKKFDAGEDVSDAIDWSQAHEKRQQAKLEELRTMIAEGDNSGVATAQDMDEIKRAVRRKERSADT
ncbi:hypothetical protein [Amorphus sp. 3PC139-8]|uniref:hypothetical protein n=1 Tax=Amorphus sp. 3PC139-8 TaxID=2735676 RepID=UPI00345CB181